MVALGIGSARGRIGVGVLSNVDCDGGELGARLSGGRVRCQEDTGPGVVRRRHGVVRRSRGPGVVRRTVDGGRLSSSRSSQEDTGGIASSEGI